MIVISLIFNRYILELTTTLKASCCCLVFDRKTIIKNYATDFNSNIKFNRLLNTILVFVAIKELSLILLDKESLI